MLNNCTKLHKVLRSSLRSCLLSLRLQQIPLIILRFLSQFSLMFLPFLSHLSLICLICSLISLSPISAFQVYYLQSVHKHLPLRVICSAILGRKMQNLSLFGCVLIRNCTEMTGVGRRVSFDCVSTHAKPPLLVIHSVNSIEHGLSFHKQSAVSCDISVI